MKISASLGVFFDDLKVTHHTGVEQSDDYYAFGLAFNSYSREKNTKNNYTYNGKELQDELDLGWMDYGARMYMPEIGRWGVVDRMSEKYLQISPYNYVLNNPLKYVDPDGNDVTIPKANDRAVILDMINSKAAGTFAYNKDGKLYLAKAADKNSTGSSYYTEKLLSAIKDKHNVSIEIGQTFKDASGKDQSIDDKAGGGVTVLGIDNNGQRAAKVIISGNENRDIKDEDGKPLKDEPADILAHELVGHAIPYSTATKDTGNAVENENKVREQQPAGSNKKRAKEPKHSEADTPIVGKIN